MQNWKPQSIYMTAKAFDNFGNYFNELRPFTIHFFWSETSKVHTLGQDFQPLYFWQPCICAACLKLQNANWSLFSFSKLILLLWENIWSQLILLLWENISSQLILLHWENISSQLILLLRENISSQLILLLWENISLSSGFLPLHTAAGKRQSTAGALFQCHGLDQLETYKNPA